MSLGEPEVPWAVEFAPAVFEMVSIRKAYDSHEQYGEGDPADMIQGGASSYVYLRERDPAFLVTELPYFQATEIADQSPTDQSRREVLLQAIDQEERMYGVQNGILERVNHLLTRDTRFIRAVRQFAEARSEERRVGKEGRARWQRGHG